MKKPTHRCVSGAFVMSAALLLSGCGSDDASTSQSTEAIVTSIPTQTTATAESDGGTTVTVTETATDFADPDLARIEIGVEASAAQATDAQNQVAATVEAVKSAIEGQGVTSDNISTSSYSLYPSYDYTSDNASTVSSYSLEQYLTVENVSVDKASGVISAAIQAGADVITDISYTSSSYDTVYNNALATATVAAQEKAAAIAAAEGLSLGNLVSVEEGYQGASARYVTDSSVNVTSDATSVSIDPGQLEIEATVTVVYEME